MRPSTLPLALLPLACLCAGLAAADAARADVTTFAQAGGWEAFGGEASDGRQVCGIAIRNEARGEAMVLKWFSGDHVLTLQVMNRGWSLPSHAAVPVSLRIDADPAWTTTALGSGHTLEWVLADSNIPAFEKEFRTGANMVLQVHGASEAPWQASLSGSEAIAQSMVACMKLVKVLHAAPPDIRDTPWATQPVPAPGESPAGGVVMPRRQRVT